MIRRHAIAFVGLALAVACLAVIAPALLDHALAQVEIRGSL